MGYQKTKEIQYQEQVDLRSSKGLSKLGLTTNSVWNGDPRRLVFILARYKFVSKMFSGKSRVLEIGCGDAFGARTVQQEVDSLTVTDFDPVFIDDVKDRMEDNWPLEAVVHDFLDGPLPSGFDAAYSLDVLEHIPQEQEQIFISNIVKSISDHGALIIGTPSIQSQEYANGPSKEGHVNCKDQPELKSLMEMFFQNVFMFSMNDEMVHTGFHPMAHYLLALCCGKNL